MLFQGSEHKLKQGKNEVPGRKRYIHVHAVIIPGNILLECAEPVNRDVSIGEVRYCLGTERLMIKFKVKINLGNS